MPQASDAQRDLMAQWFGDPVSDGGPLDFLMARGWSCRGGMFRPPVPYYRPSIYELECVDFLCDEWDYGCDRLAAAPFTPVT